jgi:hypothetical protein
MRYNPGLLRKPCRFWSQVQETDMKRIGNSICAVLLGVCGTFVLRAQPATKPATAVPRLVKFSGTLTDGGGKPLTGIVGVTFSLYEGQEGGSPIWMETQNVQAGGNGQFTVLLGSTKNEGLPAEAFASGQRWLGVQAQGEAERPRMLMASVPYSLKAVDAETLGGLPASAFALAGSANPGAAKAEAMPSAGGPLKPAAAATPDQTGSGTANYITIWTAATTLGNSKLYQTAAGNVGLGTTTPTARLEAVTSSATGTGVLGYVASTTGVNYGVTGKTTSSTGTGVLGAALATSGANYGVYGSTASPSGTAVYGINSGATGNAYGIFGKSASTTGVGVEGSATATTGVNTGVLGLTASSSGAGVIGQATAASGADYGVYGTTVSPNGISVYGLATSGTAVGGVTSGTTGYGLYGVNTATTGNAFGAYGSSASPAGYAVYGVNTATTGHAYGVVGTNASTEGIGVQGSASATSGSTYGVYGSVVSPNGIAVSGVATSGTGVVGNTTNPTGYGVYGGNAATTGAAYGVAGVTSSTGGVAVQGAATATSGSTYGVYGSTASPAGISVYGTATTGTGVAGGSSGPSGYGVYGANNATSGSAIGVYGTSSSPAGIGVLASSTGGGTALVATATGGGSAGQFNGNVGITGNLVVNGTVSKSGGSFRIDHPLDPEHKYLYHSFVESPDMMNIYNGVVTLSRRGDAVVKLPDWFDALNRDFRYQLTCIGGFAPVYVASEVSSNQFKIGGGRPGMKVSWQVTGIRRDAFANEHRIPVEENKPPVE